MVILLPSVRLYLLIIHLHLVVVTDADFKHEYNLPHDDRLFFDLDLLWFSYPTLLSESNRVKIVLIQLF